MEVDPRLLEYYRGRHDEKARLSEGTGRLEFVRTVELLCRFLPDPPGRVIDIGGGPGLYSAWLVARGFRVDLVDPVSVHVEAAAAAGASSATLGDARSLASPDDVYDVVLLLGPLYHLRDASDRLRSLREARRVLRPGGLLFAAFITRGAVFLDGFAKGWAYEPGAAGVTRQIALEGRSDQQGSGFSAISYFHLPSEARSELETEGLEVLGLFGVEGPAWIAPDADERWNSDQGREAMLEAARACEEDPELQGLSGHLLAVARNG